MISLDTFGAATQCMYVFVVRGVCVSVCWLCMLAVSWLRVPKNHYTEYVFVVCVLTVFCDGIVLPVSSSCGVDNIFFSLIEPHTYGDTYNAAAIA